MSKRRLPPKERQKDLDAYDALETFDDYSPANPAFSKENALAAKTLMQSKQTTEVQTIAAAKGASDDANDGEWAFHAVMQGVDNQAIAQYGEDSNQVQSLGLKKKSEYKKKSSKKTTPPQS